LGGALLGISLPLQLNFMAFALPGAVAALAMTLYAISSERNAASVTAPLSPAKA
jgi:AAHS family benzoate transporter-like MFS transporter